MYIQNGMIATSNPHDWVTSIAPIFVDHGSYHLVGVFSVFHYNQRKKIAHSLKEISPARCFSGLKDLWHFVAVTLDVVFTPHINNIRSFNVYIPMIFPSYW